MVDKADILPFRRLSADSSGSDDGKDWLRELNFEDRFLTQRKGHLGYTFDSYGIAAVIPEAILLAHFSPDHMGMKFLWVDSKKFCKYFEKVAMLPEVSQEGKNPHDEHYLAGPADSDHYE